MFKTDKFGKNDIRSVACKEEYDQKVSKMGVEEARKLLRIEKDWKKISRDAALTQLLMPPILAVGALIRYLNPPGLFHMPTFESKVLGIGAGIIAIFSTAAIPTGINLIQVRDEYARRVVVLERRLKELGEAIQ